MYNYGLWQGHKEISTYKEGISVALKENMNPKFSS
jgi:hypothetical protein